MEKGRIKSAGRIHEILITIENKVLSIEESTSFSLDTTDQIQVLKPPIHRNLNPGFNFYLNINAG